MGTPDTLLRAANYVQMLEERQGLKISCIEEIAYRMGFIDSTKLAEIGATLCQRVSKLLAWTRCRQRIILELTAGRVAAACQVCGGQLLRCVAQQRAYSKKPKC